MPYYQHFGLDRDPFLDTADPHFYRSTGNLAHAKNRLVQSIEQSRGLMIVVVCVRKSIVTSDECR